MKLQMITQTLLLAIGLLSGVANATFGAQILIDNVAATSTATFYSPTATYKLRVLSDGADIQTPLPDLSALTGVFPENIVVGTGTAYQTVGVDYPLTVSSGAFSFQLPSSTFTDADGFNNTELTVSFKVGFGLSAATIVVASTDVAPTETWLLRTPAGRYALAVTASDSAIQLSTSNADYSFSAIAAASASGSSSLSLNAASGTSPTTTNSNTRVLLPFSITNANPGTYTIAFPAGSICTTGLAICNAATTVTVVMKIGFSLTAIDIVKTSADTTSVASAWNSRTVSNTYALILKTSSTTLSAATGKYTKAAVTWADNAAAASTAIVLGTPSLSSGGSTAIKFPLDFSTAAFGTYTATVAEAALCTADESTCNCASTISTGVLKVGFDVSMDIVSHGTTTSVKDKWLTRTTGSLYDLVISADVITVVVASAGTVSQVITGGASPTASGADTFTLTSDNKASIVMAFSSVSPGKYTLNVAQGKLCTASSAACNAATTTTSALVWKVGFEVTAVVLDGTDSIVTTNWLNPANTIKVEVRVTTAGITLPYTSSNLPSLETVFSETSGLNQLSKAVATTTKVRYTLDVSSSTVEGGYDFDIEQGMLCTTSSAKCNAELFSATRVLVGFPFTLAFLTDDGEDTDVSTHWLSAGTDVLFSLTRAGDADLDAVAPDFDDIIVAPTGVPSGSDVASTDGYKYQIDTSALLPGRHTFTIIEGAGDNGVTDTTSATFAANFETTTNLLIGFEVEMAILSAASDDITANWLHPDSTFAIRITAASSTLLYKFATSYLTSPPALDTVITTVSSVASSTDEVTATGANEDGMYVAPVSGNPGYLQYTIDTGLGAAKYTVTATQGTLTNGMSGAGEIKNAEAEVTLRIGWVPAITILDGAASDGNIAIEGLWDADQVTEPDTATPTFANSIRVSISYASIKAYSSTELASAALGCASVFEWPEGLDVSSTPTLSANKLVYSITGFLAPSDTYDIALKQGQLTDTLGEANGIHNAPVKVRVVLGALLSVYTVDGASKLTSRGTGMSLTNLDAIRLRIEGVGDDTHPLMDIIAELTSEGGSSSAFPLVGGRLSLPIQAGQDYIEYALDISALPDGMYTALINETAPLTDLVRQSQLFQPQTFRLVLDRTPPTCNIETGIIDVGVVYIGSASEILLPLDSFEDAVSTSATLLRVLSVDARDMHLFALKKIDSTLPFTLANSKLQSTPSVRGPEGLVTAVMQVADEAGNIATANITFKVVEKLKPRIEVQDTRHVSTLDSLANDNTIYTGGGAGTAVCAADNTCKVKLTVITNYFLSVNALDQTDISVTGPAETDIVDFEVLTFTVSADLKRYTWELRVNDLMDADVVHIHIPEDASTTKEKSESTGASLIATVVIDRQPPIGGAQYIGQIKGTALVPYMYNISCPLASSCLLDFFTDTNAVTAPRDIYLVSVAPTTIAGISFYPGYQGLAYFSGNPLFSPGADGFLDFVVTARDAAGNTATRPIRLTVKPFDPDAKLLALRDKLVFTEGGAAVPLFAKSSFAYTRNGAQVLVSSVFVYISNSDPTGETIVVPSPPPANADDVRYRDSTTGMLVQGIRTSSGAPGILPSAVETWIKTIAFQNTNTNPGIVTRTVRLEVLGANDLVVSSTTRALGITTVNQAPVVTGGKLILYIEPSVGAKQTSADVLVFPDAVVTDADDASMAIGAVTIGSCDTARDELYLTPGYASPPRVRAVWSPTTCILALRSVDSPAPMTLAEIQAAFRAVKYTNKDLVNPLNRVASPLIRRITAFVQDIGNSGLVSVARSLPHSFDLRLTGVDDPPVYIPEKAFQVNGILYSADTYANIRLNTVGSEQYRQRTFVLLRPKEGAVTEVTFSFDLRAVTGAPGYFALGAIFDPDTSVAPANNVDAMLVSPTSNAEVAPGDVPSSLGAWWQSVEWVYSPTALSTLKIKIDSSFPDGNLGTYKWRIKYSGIFDIDFWIDVRQEACVFEDATNYALLAYGNSYVVEQFYPLNTLCEYAPLVLKADDDPTEPVVLSRGGFDSKAADMATKASVLEKQGVSIAGRVVAMAEERAGARGTFQMAWTGRILDNVAELPLTAGVTSGAAVQALPPKESVQLDSSLVLKFGPPGTQFLEPIKVCMFVGDTAAGFGRIMYKASQIDPNDITKGYTQWRITVGSSFDPITGQLCGSITSFSVVASALLTVRESPVVHKAVLMSGACPNLCSGNGYCRTFGKCECFPGFTENDCSHRSCPSGPSWTTDIVTSTAVGYTVHAQAECSAVGVCDKKRGECKCGLLYEGNACQRMTCPNDCSNHGKCRTLGELPGVKASSYSSWELDRVTRCLCDSGFTGPDCSERICPFGDDIETACDYSQVQVQRLTLSFGTLPGSAVLGGNELALQFHDKQGHILSTPRIQGIWDGSLATTTSIANGLKSVPQFALDNVEVSLGGGTNMYREYLITFSGEAVQGDQLPLSCPVNSVGSIGCPFFGCQPRFQQLRMTNAMPVSGVTFNDTVSMLVTSPPLDDGDETTPGLFAVEISVTITRKLIAKQEFFTYSADSLVYGKRVSSTDPTKKSPSLPETPVPITGKSRWSIPIFYGLYVDFDNDDSVILPPLLASQTVTTATYNFGWRLPSCTIETAVPAASQLESLECGGRGVCNRISGVCDCFLGYSGYTCHSKDETE